MGFVSSKADLDFWIRKVEGGSYEYVASYVDEIPDGSPEPNKNKVVQVTSMFDADHAHCEVTRRSVSGILVFINSTPVKWYSKCKRRLKHLHMDWDWLLHELLILRQNSAMLYG
jgi:hypothetical protein